MCKWGWETYLEQLGKLPWGRDIGAELQRMKRNRGDEGHPSSCTKAFSNHVEKTSQVVPLPSLVQVL